MAFGYVISLDLDDRLAVVVGGGPVATSRARDLRDAGAHVTVVTPAPCAALAAAVADDPQLHVDARSYIEGDLAGAAIAIVTGEDDTDVAAFWDESRRRGTLASVLDDLEHTDFAAPALVRSGALRIAIATAGRAPALAKRLRVHLEATLGQTGGQLVDAVARARELAGPRDVPFDQWAARWEVALADLDGLLDQIRAGHTERVVARIVQVVTAAAPATGPASAQGLPR